MKSQIIITHTDDGRIQFQYNDHVVEPGKVKTVTMPLEELAAIDEKGDNKAAIAAQYLVMKMELSLFEMYVEDLIDEIPKDSEENPGIWNPN